MTDPLTQTTHSLRLTPRKGRPALSDALCSYPLYILYIFLAQHSVTFLFTAYHLMAAELRIPRRDCNCLR